MYVNKYDCNIAQKKIVLQQWIACASQVKFKIYNSPTIAAMCASNNQ